MAEINDTTLEQIPSLTECKLKTIWMINYENQKTRCLLHFFNTTACTEKGKESSNLKRAIERKTIGFDLSGLDSEKENRRKMV